MNGKLVFKYLQGIGYYCWINSKEVVVFVIDNFSYLVLVNVDMDDFILLVSDVGCCIKKFLNGNLLFIQCNEVGLWQIMELLFYCWGNYQL